MPAKVSVQFTTGARFDQKVSPPLAARRQESAAPGQKPVSVVASRRPRSNSSEEIPAAKSQAPTAVQPVEPEDAYLTGVSRSLQRRLLGLNVQGSYGQSRPVPDTQAPGVHSTGSYTGTVSVPAQDLHHKTL